MGTAEHPGHDWDGPLLDDPNEFICRRCGKTLDEVDEQDGPVICWGEED